MEITRTVETSAPVEKVFAYLTDFENTNEWDPGTVRTTRTAGDGGVGTKYHNVSKFLGRKTELDYTVRTLAEPSRFVIVGENESANTSDTMTFEPTRTGTKVTYTAVFEFKGAAGKVAAVLSPLLALALKRLGDETAKSIEQTLERL